MLENKDTEPLNGHKASHHDLPLKSFWTFHSGDRHLICWKSKERYLSQYLSEEIFVFLTIPLTLFNYSQRKRKAKHNLTKDTSFRMEQDLSSLASFKLNFLSLYWTKLSYQGEFWIALDLRIPKLLLILRFDAIITEKTA